MNNKFEQHLKQSLDNYQANYDPAHWADMNKRLDKLQAGKSSSLGKTIGIAAGVVATAGLIYFFSTNNADNKPTTQANTTAQNVTVTNNEIKENTAQQPIEQKTEVISHQSSPNNNQKEKVVAENKNAEQKTISQDKNETPVINNTTTQNNTQVQQNNTPESQNSQAAFSAAFHCQNSVCAGSSVEFTADNAKVPCTYKWDFGDGKTSGETNPKHVYAKAGTYNVKLHLTSIKDKTSDEQKNTFTVNPVPNIDMNYYFSDDNNPSLVSFEAKDGSVKDWSWDFGDKQTANKQNPSHEYKKGSWDVIVTATNTSSCSSTARKTVIIENEFPLAPSAFTPNGDNHDDTWMPVSFLNGDYNFILTIYDVNGKEIYKTSDKNRPWDGGNAKPNERFTWKASVKDKSGKESNYSGVITVIVN